ncbi:MAG TPA: MAPEG family protein [Rhizobiales bacterium]|nr:MAPEG family protein [Hyphomicrobiales bacterium]
MTDLHWLAATCLMVAFFWLPYVLNRMGVLGILGAMGNPDPNDKPLSKWAARARAAHNNATENLALFAPLILIANALALSGTMTLLMAQLFFAARLVHFVVYTAGIPVARTLAFAAGWIATLGVAGVILGFLS